jgi:hypothetical protein
MTDNEVRSAFAALREMDADTLPPVETLLPGVRDQHSVAVLSVWKPGIAASFIIAACLITGWVLQQHRAQLASDGRALVLWQSSTDALLDMARSNPIRSIDPLPLTSDQFVYPTTKGN